ncbi:IS110 family transposase [Candidatus Woesearchaeota archaeon]|nr:IS110 family transposase [Candidatus Woesearchaeota archaeon]
METKFFVALDVHVESTEYVVRTWRGDVVLEGSCATSYPDLKSILEPYMHSCVVGIEASTCFYPLRAGFMHDNITVKVANVLQIRQLIAKTDKLDARRLSDMLRLGTFPESFIPPKEIQELRELVAIRHSFLQESNKVESKIWASLARDGIKIPTRSLFTKEGFKHVNAISSSKRGSWNLKCLVSHYEYLTNQLENTTQALTKKVEQYFPKEFEKLQEIDGIGKIIASYVIAEVCPISRFSSEKKLRRYAGVIPCLRESAGKPHGSLLPKASSRALLRWALVMAAHASKRKKGSRLQAYYNSKKKAAKQKKIMSVARCISDLVYKKLNE